MINLVENSKLVADNEVVIGGLKYMLTDDETIKLNDIIKGMIASRNGKGVAKPETAPKAKKQFNGKAKGVTVAMKATGKTVSLEGYVGKDVWVVLQRRFEALGGKYDKATKSITFSTAKNAKEFASNPEVTAEEREGIWKEWRA